jgi:hypothetical protein
VDRVHDSFGKVGTAGLLTERGIAPVMWRHEQAFFVLKDFEEPATSDQIAQIRSFQRDLEAALA